MLLLYIEQVISNDGTVFTVLTNFEAPHYCLRMFDILHPSKVYSFLSDNFVTFSLV